MEAIGPMPSFDDEEDLLRQANDVGYGLVAGIWTRDLRNARRVARARPAGTVPCNTYSRLSLATPFRGAGTSGVGRERGRHRIRACMQRKSVCQGPDEEPLP